MPVKFLASHNCIIFGPSRAGKTQFILQVIREKLIEPMPKKIYYMYGMEQEFMYTWNEEEEIPIKFIKGLEFDKLDTSEPSLLVVDDLCLSDNKEIASCFIRGSHHLSISTFYITQNLFPNCDLFRMMSSNAHYFVLFNSQRHFRQINTLARQMFCGNDVSRVINAYKRTSGKDRSFIVLSLAPGLPHELTVMTDWWEWLPSVFL